LLPPALFTGKCLLEIPDEVGNVLDPGGYTHQRIGDSHACATFRPGLMEDGVRSRNYERARVAKVARADDRFQPVDEVETFLARHELEREQPPATSKQRLFARRN